MNLTNLAVPTLIAPDLVMVHPMPSMSGYVAYLKITAGSNKGETRQGDLFNSPFQLGNVDRNYTAAAVVEEVTVDASIQATAAWFPVYNGDAPEAKAKIVSITHGTTTETVADDATVTVGTDGKTLTFSNGTGYTIVNGDKVKVKYVYDNVIIPQNDLPIVNAEMDKIQLLARARRVAIYYSNLAAFEAKTDYGFDLGETLATQAVARLNYEIDSEVVHLLIEGADQNADATAALTELTWSKTLPIGVNVRLSA